MLLIIYTKIQVGRVVISYTHLHSPTHQTGITTKKNGIINLNNQLKTNWTDILYPRIYIRSHIYTGKKAGPAPTCSSWESGWTSQLQRFPLRYGIEGPQYHTRLPSPEHQSLQDPCAEFLFHTTYKHHLSWVEQFPLYFKSLRECNSLHPIFCYHVLQSSCLAEESAARSHIVEVQVDSTGTEWQELSCVALGQRQSAPPSHFFGKTDWHHSPHWDPLAPPSHFLAANPAWSDWVVWFYNKRHLFLTRPNSAEPSLHMVKSWSV